MSDGRVSRRRVLAAAGTAVGGSVTGCVQHLPVDKGVPDESGDSTIQVRPDGDFFNSGAADDPLGSIARAVNVADPGDTVSVHPGEYVELVEIDAGGDPERPVTLTGPRDAVLKPPEGQESAVVEIDASCVHLTGLTITGLHDPNAPADPDSYHPDKLISINSDVGGPGDYLEGLVVSPHRLGNAGQSLINSVQFKDSEIGGFEVIGPAGTKWIFGDSDGHNGEFVYLGTAPDNRIERGYERYDRTRNVRVHHIDNSAGHLHAEFVDCKAGVENVTIEYCTDAGGLKTNDSYYGRSVSMDGVGCTVRWNVFRDMNGDGVRIGPQNYLSGLDYVDSEPQTAFERRLGTAHAIYGNVFTGCTRDAINFLRESRRPGRDSNPTTDDQRTVCGNLIDGYSDGDHATSCGQSDPSSDQVGHLAGDSPWDGDAPTMAAVFDRYATDPDLSVTVLRETVPTDTEVEIPVSITNTGGTTAEAVIRLRIREHVLDEGSVSIEPTEEGRVTLTDTGRSVTGEMAVMVNGQKHGRVAVLDGN